MWGSDTPFQSYVADIDGQYVSLRSTYKAETDCVHALPAHLKRLVGEQNTLAWLNLKDASVLTRT
jgi:hypothetical protein